MVILMIAVLFAITLLYLLFIAVRLGAHQRLPLAFRPISLEAIPDRAARKHGSRVLFTSDRPCEWEIGSLRYRYPNRLEWSASRIVSTVGILATVLRERFAVRTGDRVAILKQNHLDIHLFALSAVRAGAIGCPINGNFAAADLAPYLSKIGACLLISDCATLGRIVQSGGSFGPVQVILVAEPRPSPEGAPNRWRDLLASRFPAIRLAWLEEAVFGVIPESRPLSRPADEILFLVHSSGTTGFPKAVALRNGAQSRAVRGWLRYVLVSRTTDKAFLAVPNNHQAVILTFHAALLLGLRIHWTGAYDRDFDAETVASELARGGFTGFFGFPIVYTQLTAIDLEKRDLSKMRFWASTADASHETVQRRLVGFGNALRRLGLPIDGSVYLDAQGSSEVGTPSVLRYVTTLTKRFERRIGRSGSTPFGPQTRVVTTDGALARRNEAGRLEVRGQTVFDSYWNDDALKELAFRDGWFFTGDIVRRGSDGHFVQLDREVDVIQTTQGAVYSLLIEEKLHKHPAVFDVCVYGERQRDGSQKPAAAVALRPGFEMTSESIRADFNRTIGGRESLGRVDVIPWNEFPMGVTGKTLKRTFRELTEGALIETSGDGPRRPICRSRAGDRGGSPDGGGSSDEDRGAGPPR